ncbi:MAG: ABC transporter ATP-binding protein [Helicobacteraceae bacterium]|jgi:iron complex transport system ATP-binding protein|nr:ABC transporter ATP-binding protein [Helicobacteraceae bacterium]
MLKTEKLRASYGSKTILRDISFLVEREEIVSILGANGSGKSTLLKTLCGILPYRGEAQVDSLDIKKLNAKQRASAFSYVAQSVFMPFSFSVFDVALMGRFSQSPFGFDYSKADKQAALNALEIVGAIGLKDRMFNAISGGERQLTIIARALAQESKIILLDEPVTGLDLGATLRLLTLLQELRSQGKTILQTTHHPDHALRISDRVLWIDKGSAIAFGKSADIITADRIKTIYGVKSEIFAHKSGHSFVVPIAFA